MTLVNQFFTIPDCWVGSSRIRINFLSECGPLNKRHESQILRLSYIRLRSPFSIFRWKYYKRSSDRSSEFFGPDGSHQLFRSGVYFSQISRLPKIVFGHSSDVESSKIRMSDFEDPIFPCTVSRVCRISSKSEVRRSDPPLYCFLRM